MPNNIFFNLINNAAFLLALWAIYGVITTKNWSLKANIEKMLAGLIIGLIGMAIMHDPFSFSFGVVFDTRSILLSLSGLFFGSVPTLIAVIITTLYRIYTGGAGVLAGVGVILTSAGIGLAWRYFRRKHDKEISAWELYLFGILVHIVMLIMMLTFPWEIASEILKEISLPVLILYPLTTVLMGMLFSNQLAREKIESALKKEREKAEKFLNLTPALIIALDLHGNITMINDRGCHLLESKHEAIIGKNWFESFLQEHIREQAKSIYSQLLDGNLELSGYYESAILTAKGNEKILQWHYSIVEDNEGKINGVLISAVDITERKKTEESLQENEEILRLSTELANVAVWEFSFATNSMIRSKNHDTLYGLEWQSTWKFETFLNSTHPDDREYSNQIIQSSAAPGGPDRYKFDFRVVYPDQSIHWLSVVGQVVVRNSEGQGMIVRGALIDITERKQTEKSIARLNERITLATQAAQMGVWDWDIVNNELVWDDKMYALYGIEKGDFSGAYEAWTKGLHPDDLARCELETQNAIHGEKAFDTEFRVLWPDGTVRHLKANADVIKDSDGNPVRMVGVNYDITDRKLTDEKLRQSEELFSNAFHVGPAAMTITRIADGKFINVNDTFLDLFEFSREEVIGHTSTDLNMWTPEERKKLIRKQIESGGLRNTELVAQAKSGRPINILFSSKPMMLGEEECHLTTMINITERKRTEEERQKFVMLADSSSEFIGMCDLDFNPIYVNPAGIQMVGLRDLEDACQVKVQDYFFPEDQRFITDEFFPRVLREGHGDVEIRLRNFQTGKAIWMLYYLFSVRQDNGKVIGWATVSRDITERKLTENRLLLHSEIVANMDEGVYLMRAQDETIVYTNSALERIFGYGPDEMIGKHISIINTSTENDPEDTMKEIRAIIEIEGGWQGEVLNVRKDGIPFWSHVNVSVFDHSEYGTVWLGVHADITERVKAEEEKQQMEAHLRQQQKLESIGTLASGVAHEINNPIMGIMNYASLIGERLDPSQSQLHEFADEIGHETERIAKIVSNLLTFARQEKQSHSPARITDIVDGTLSLIRTVIKRDQITLEVDVPDDLPELKCRSQQIQQVMMNLLTNARDALNERYPEYDPNKIIKMSVHLFEKEGRRWLRTTVEDHGVGIPVEIRERIFDPFYTTKGRATGTGLGLSISLGIVQEHHGELTFESEEGQPTRFYLDLPVDNGWNL
jgi:PAS domain S-box-containing protein